MMFVQIVSLLRRGTNGDKCDTYLSVYVVSRPKRL